MLRSLILQQKEERDFLLSQPYQERQNSKNKQELLKSPLIKLLTGPRRAGKSVSALQILRNQNFAYLNFDDEQILNNFNEDLILQYLLEIYPSFDFLFLDEIQNVPNWDIWVSKLYRRGINLFITGSNAKLLSNEMASLLTGRYIQINIMPFSYKEFTDFINLPYKYNTPKEKANMQIAANDYLINGGFPETVKQRSITKDYLSLLFDSILLKDVARRYKIRHSDTLYNLANYLLANFCNPISFNDLAKDLDLGSTHTAQKYCKYLAEPYLFYYLPRFNSKLKLMQKAPQKIYVVDNGFVFARSFNVSENLGRLLENLVFTELLRRNFIVGQTVFYYKTKNDKEIDFVCRKNHKVTQLLQVCFDISNEKTRKREISALLEAADELSCNNVKIISFEQEFSLTGKSLQIDVVPISKWLLNSRI